MYKRSVRSMRISRKIEVATSTAKRKSSGRFLKLNDVSQEKKKTRASSEARVLNVLLRYTHAQQLTVVSHADHSAYGSNLEEYVGLRLMHHIGEPCSEAAASWPQSFSNHERISCPLGLVTRITPVFPDSRESVGFGLEDGDWPTNSPKRFD